MLQKMLNREEKMHEILEHVHNQHKGSAIRIPNFLPPKVNFFSLIFHTCSMALRIYLYIYIYISS
jgi:hypothetical protein